MKSKTTLNKIQEEFQIEVRVESMSKQNILSILDWRKRNLKTVKRNWRFANVEKVVVLVFARASVDAKNRYILWKTNKTSKINDESLHVIPIFLESGLGNLLFMINLTIHVEQVRSNQLILCVGRSRCRPSNCLSHCLRIPFPKSPLGFLCY